MALVQGGGATRSLQSRFLKEQARRNAGQTPTPPGQRAPSYAPPRPARSTGSSSGGYRAVGGGAPAAVTAAAPAPPPPPPNWVQVAQPPSTAAAPAPSPYPWLDTEFGKYFGAIQQDFADRGLLDSTNKMGPMKELADAFTARYAQESRTDNQRAIDNAMRLWEMLTSGELSRAQLLGSTTMTMPAQPGLFANIFNQPYLPPLKSAGGPVGDAKVVSKAPYIHTDRGQVVPAYDEQVETLGYQQFQQDKADAAANRAIQQAYLKLAQEQAAREAVTFEREQGGGTEDDKWEAMAQEMMGNRLRGLGEGKGTNAYPTQMLTYFKSAYGIDVEELVRQNDPRAIALVQSAYGDPKRAAAVIARMQGRTPAPKVKAASSKKSKKKNKKNPNATPTSETVARFYMNPSPSLYEQYRSKS